MGKNQAFLILNPHFKIIRLTFASQKLFFNQSGNHNEQL